MTNSNKYLALTALGFFMTGCTGLTKNQAALVGAAVCGAGGAGAGAASAHQGIGGRHRNEAVGAAIGAVGGALICGGLAYLMTEDPKPAPKPAPRNSETTGDEARYSCSPASPARRASCASLRLAPAHPARSAFR